VTRPPPLVTGVQRAALRVVPSKGSKALAALNGG
jgi:hypothetical protein